MPTFQVRNKRTKIVLGEVTVPDETKVLDALASDTGCGIDDVARSLGSTVEDAKAALDIVEVREDTPMPRKPKAEFRTLPRRRLFG